MDTHDGGVQPFSIVRVIIMSTDRRCAMHERGGSDEIQMQVSQAETEERLTQEQFQCHAFPYQKTCSEFKRLVRDRRIGKENQGSRGGEFNESACEIKSRVCEGFGPASRYKDGRGIQVE